MSIKILRAEEVDSYMQKRDVILVDTREKRAYMEYHIPGAIHVPVEKLNVFLLYKYVQVILYCERGIVSAREAKRYDMQGYSMGTVAGGITAYRQVHGKSH